MRISILSIGAIASVLALNAFATTSTVTSRDYVDTQNALKQDLIETDDTYWDGYFGVTDTLVSNDAEDGDGIQGYKYGIFTDSYDINNMGGVRWILYNEDAYLIGKTIPTTAATADLIRNATKMTCVEYIGGQQNGVPEDCLLWRMPDNAVW